MSVPQIFGATLILGCCLFLLCVAVVRAYEWGGPWTVGIVIFAIGCGLFLCGCSLGGIRDADTGIPKVHPPKPCEFVVRDKEGHVIRCMSRAEAEREIMRPAGNTW